MDYYHLAIRNNNVKIMKPIKYALIGFGLNARGHKAELESHQILKGRAHLTVVFDPDSEMQDQVKNMCDIKLAPSFDALLDTKGLEAAIICSPPQYHADQVVAALESGLHVYSEVPMALTMKDVERIVNAESESGKKYQLGENYCFYPEILYAGFLSASGKIGTRVYAEAEYLHDITYRWRENGHGDVDTPRIDSWYQLFDPLMYAHSIGPAQVALGGLKNPSQFMQVTSLATDLGGYQGEPICRPAKAFQVGLFQTESGAIAKCANAYIVAREPTRLIIQVIGELGSYECCELGKPGRLFLAEGHKVTFNRHRKGKSRIIKEDDISEIVPPLEGLYYGASARIVDDWLTAIEKNIRPKINSRIAANFCLSGIAASKSARSGGKPIRIKIYAD
jgi:predicted dehydrogenase